MALSVVIPVAFSAFQPAALHRPSILQVQIMVSLFVQFLENLRGVVVLIRKVPFPGQRGDFLRKVGDFKVAFATDERGWCSFQIVQV